MEFTHDTHDGFYDDTLSIKTDHGVDVKIYFTGGNAEEIEIDDMSCNAMSDTLCGVYLRINFRLISVAELIRKAGEELPDYQREALTEIRADEAMARELSSPQMTGRI